MKITPIVTETTYNINLSRSEFVLLRSIVGSANVTRLVDAGVKPDEAEKIYPMYDSLTKFI